MHRRLPHDHSNLLRHNGVVHALDLCLSRFKVAAVVNGEIGDRRKLRVGFLQSDATAHIDGRLVATRTSAFHANARGRHHSNQSVGPAHIALALDARGNFHNHHVVQLAQLANAATALLHNDGMCNGVKPFRMLGRIECGGRETAAHLLAALIEDGRATDVVAKRQPIYREALDVVMELAIELPTYQRKDLYVYQNGIFDTSTFTEASAYQSPLSALCNVSFAAK